MNPPKSSILVVSALALSVLSGCDIWSSESAIDDDIKAFVESENLPDAQSPDVRFDDPKSTVKAFRVRFGPGCDCPSECFHSRGLGLKFQNRVGWIEVLEAFCLPTPVRTRATFFDVQPGDSTLFHGEFRERFREATDGKDYEYSGIYERFLRMLARDKDTAPSTLASLVDLLFDERFSNTAEALIENPAVRSNKTLLEQLANLPDWAGYRSVKEEAKELLNQMS